tara:strand:+ start:45 stop:344 length:300 start_codon:yes stop_codon:yes gene_type:complete
MIKILEKITKGANVFGTDRNGTYCIVKGQRIMWFIDLGHVKTIDDHLDNIRLNNTAPVYYFATDEKQLMYSSLERIPLKIVGTRVQSADLQQAKIFNLD